MLSPMSHNKGELYWLWSIQRVSAQPLLLADVLLNIATETKSVAFGV